MEKEKIFKEEMKNKNKKQISTPNKNSSIKFLPKYFRKWNKIKNHILICKNYDVNKII